LQFKGSYSQYFALVAQNHFNIHVTQHARGDLERHSQVQRRKMYSITVLSMADHRGKQKIRHTHHETPRCRHPSEISHGGSKKNRPTQSATANISQHCSIIK